MNICLFLTALLLTFNVHSAEPNYKTGYPMSFELDAVPVSDIVRAVFTEVVKTQYVLEPAVIADTRPASFRWTSANGNIKPFLAAFLDVLGYQIKPVDGVDLITVKDKEDKDKPFFEPGKVPFVYHPKFRDGSYLIDLLSPLLKGSFSASKLIHAPESAKQDASANVPAGSAAATVDRKADDTLVFLGTDAEVELLNKLLSQVDIASGEVLVRGVLFEVATGSNSGTGIQLATTLLNSALSVGVGGPILPMANAAASVANQFLQIKSGHPGGAVSVDAVMSALSTDSRFKMLSSPSLRVISGSTAHITIGQDVPILGALSYPQGAGQAVQSVQYRPSGVLFDLTPSVRESIIDLKINQQISSFVQTNTGVNNSPTLNKREISTSVSANDGDVVILGGLNETKSTNVQSGLSFLPDWIFSDSTTSSDSEIILVIQINRV